MQVLALVATAALIFASLFVGVRLLFLFRRNSGVPELLLGVMQVATGIGYPLRIAAEGTSGNSVAMFVIASDTFLAIAYGAFYLFICRVFRPRVTWARIAAGAGILVIAGRTVVGSIGVLENGAGDMAAMPTQQIFTQIGPLVLAYVWVTIESLSYYAKMRRRVKLGLAEAEVSNRFLLWALMSISALSGTGVAAAAAMSNVSVYENPAVMLVAGITGALQAAFLLLALAPPRSYLEWVRGRASSTAVAQA